MGDSLTLLLPYPPSVNGLWRTVGGRTMLSKRYRAWQAQADEWLCRGLPMGGKLPSEAWNGPVTVETRLNPPDKRRRDLDNVGAKAILDRLVAWQIIADDSQVQKLSMEWDTENVSPGAALVMITRPAAAQESCQRKGERATQTGKHRDSEPAGGVEHRASPASREGKDGT